MLKWNLINDKKTQVLSIAMLRESLGIFWEASFAIANNMHVKSEHHIKGLHIKYCLPVPGTRTVAMSFTHLFADSNKGIF